MSKVADFGVDCEADGEEDEDGTEVPTWTAVCAVRKIIVNAEVRGCAIFVELLAANYNQVSLKAVAKSHTFIVNFGLF